MILKEELKLQFPKDTKDLFNIKFYKDSFLNISNEDKEKYNKGQFSVRLSHLDPEISFIFYIIDKIKLNNATFIFKEEMKYFGLNFKEIKEMEIILVCSIVCE